MCALPSAQLKSVLGRRSGRRLDMLNVMTWRRRCRLPGGCAWRPACWWPEGEQRVSKGSAMFTGWLAGGCEAVSSDKACARAAALQRLSTPSSFLVTPAERISHWQRLVRKPYHPGRTISTACHKAPTSLSQLPLHGWGRAVAARAARLGRKHLGHKYWLAHYWGAGALALWHLRCTSHSSGMPACGAEQWLAVRWGRVVHAHAFLSGWGKGALVPKWLCTLSMPPHTQHKQAPAMPQAGRRLQDCPRASWTAKVQPCPT